MEISKYMYYSNNLFISTLKNSGTVVGKHYCVPCQTRTLSIGYPSRIWII